jgi:hypothetical protein
MLADRRRNATAADGDRDINSAEKGAVALTAAATDPNEEEECHAMLVDDEGNAIAVDASGS